MNTSIVIKDIPEGNNQFSQISVSYHKSRKGYFLVTAPYEAGWRGLQTFSLSKMKFELIETASRFSAKRLETLAEIEKCRIEANTNETNALLYEHGVIGHDAYESGCRNIEDSNVHLAS